MELIKRRMDAMREIEVKQLTEEGFRKYGLYQNLLDDESLAQNAVFPRTFFADVLGPLDFGTETCQLYLSVR